MRLVSRLRRICAMMIVLLGLLAGLGVASVQADAPAPAGSGPRVAEQTPAIPPQQRNQYPPTFALASGNRLAAEPHAERYNIVIADGHTRKHRLRFRQAIRSDG